MINIYKWLRKFINIHLTSWVAQESGTSAQGKEREVESPKSEKMKWVSKFLKLQIKPIIIVVTGYFFSKQQLHLPLMWKKMFHEFNLQPYWWKYNITMMEKKLSCIIVIV